MTNKPNRCRRNIVPVQSTPAISEPDMRRWPHPVLTAAPQEDASLHYITCALSYQNQILADIKALLEQIVLNFPEKESTPDSTTGSYQKK